MTLGKFAHFFAVLLIALMISAVPADAHKKKHSEEAVPTATVASEPTEVGNAVARHVAEDSKDDHMAGMMDDMAEERASMSPGERLLDWLGRLHPIIVHFPIAFFPAALFTAIVGRRRPAFGKPVQFLVVAGGIIAPIAAILGWFNAIGADPDPLLTVHRWLGTAFGVAALGFGIWAWRRPEDVRGPGMIIGLSSLTAAVIVQGWYGGALVHGMDHMNW
jgi:uncharacterized membrane protein